MRAARRVAPVLLVLIVLRCASVGTGDPVVVRAEDMKTNSLTIYQGVIVWHDGEPSKGLAGHSTTESPAVYKAIEAARISFPKAWRALGNGINVYKQDRNADKIQALINAVQSILDTLPTVPAGGR